MVRGSNVNKWEFGFFADGCVYYYVFVCFVQSHAMLYAYTRAEEGVLTKGVGGRGGGGGGGGEVGGCAVWTTINNPGLKHPFAVTVFFGVSMSCKK